MTVQPAITHKETARRLRKLAKCLDHVKPEQFRMSTWWAGKPLPGCGTAACALGHACTIPEFYVLGLRLKLKCTCQYCTNAFIPVFKGMKSFEAAERFFGITQQEARDLFTSNSMRGDTPKQVAARIRIVADTYAGEPVRVLGVG
jgi:hypothetical protein